MSQALAAPLPLDAAAALGPARRRRHTSIPVLDGWRGISILLVLACHMLPLGPKWFQLNVAFGAAGMSLFFTLSGFLITSTLLERSDVRAFFIRRACRILPLLFIYIPVALLLQNAGVRHYVAHLLFVTNYDLKYVTKLTSPLWSVCAEIHFYVGAGLLVAAFGRRAFFLLPVLCALVTLERIRSGDVLSVFTHRRIDEILAGCCLALVYHGELAALVKRALARLHPLAALAMFAVVCHPAAGPLQYLRPYAGAAVVGATLMRGTGGRINAALGHPALKYVAAISYALYVFHPITYRIGWLAEVDGGKLMTYLVRRPISFALTFILAHCSTFYYESWWIQLGKRLTAEGGTPEPTPVTAAAVQA